MPGPTSSPSPSPSQSPNGQLDAAQSGPADTPSRVLRLDHLTCRADNLSDDLAELRLRRLLSGPTVAIVGSRACTQYGSHLAADLGAAFAERGVTVVVAVGYGVQCDAARGALAAGGRVLAVESADVDAWRLSGFPVDRVRENGVVLSIAASGASPSRARTSAAAEFVGHVAGGYVVVESSTRSSTLAVASARLDRGQPVHAVPGPTTSVQSTGTHLLLKAPYTGRLLTESADVSDADLQSGLPFVVATA